MTMVKRSIVGNANFVNRYRTLGTS